MNSILNSILNLFLIVIVIQFIIMKMFEINSFNMFSLIKNIIFAMILFIVFTKQKGGYKQFYKDYPLLLIIPIVYLLQYLYYPTYVGQDIVALPLTIPGYIFTHLDKIQTTESIHKDYIMCHAPNLQEGGNNMWYQYTHYQIGDYTYYIIFTSISKYDPKISLWFHYCSNKTGEKYDYKQWFDKEKYKTQINDKFLLASCNTENFNFDYRVSTYEKKYYIKFKFFPKNLTIEYNGNILSDYNQCVGSIYPFNKLSHIIPEIDGQLTGINTESFNDQMVVTKGEAKINDELFINCSSWQDCSVGTDGYYMTTWLWIYQKSENFSIYQLWYSDPEYYNNENTFKVLWIYDIKNNRVIYNTTSKTTPVYKMFGGLQESSVNMKGTSVQDKEFYYKTRIKTPEFEAETESIDNTSIKVCDNKYMYERSDTNIDYGKLEPLAQIMEEVRYDEFSNKATFKINYNGKLYNEEAKVVVDSMTWKYGWPSNYPKRNETFFSQFKLLS